MQFQTHIPFKPQTHNQIDYKSDLLFLGSCFVENIGEKLGYFKFQSRVNPFGILFHPKAVETFISNSVQKKTYSETDVFYHNEQWHCFEAHSKLSHVSKDALLRYLNEQILSTHQQIKQSTHIVITLGTAWAYRHIKTKAFVANCHKVPQVEFDKVLMEVSDIATSLKNLSILIKQVNPEATLIFTVSPVRHLKDGFVENTQSKAYLITAIHQVISFLGGMGHYFPSYEIMMDELRDYRFYDEDMIHPSPTAVNYIWEQFKTVWISPEAFKTMVEVDNVQKGLLHRPFNLNSEAYKKFRLGIQEKQNQLKKHYPHIEF